MGKIKAGIINVTGYAGVELARLLFQHPEVNLISVTGRGTAGKKLAEVFPHLAGIDLTIKTDLDEVEVVFSALPHRESAAEIIPLIKQGLKVIDLSADFRLREAGDYPRWYDSHHPAPELLDEAVYGLPELKRARIAKAKLVANPGCYPTGAILAIAPAVQAGIVKPEIIIDSKSGVSGAGRTLNMGSHYAEANEDMTAYALSGHRHLPEITQELGELTPGAAPVVTFVPHLIPMTRGIFTTGYATLIPGKLAEGDKGLLELVELYQDRYRNEPFVRVTSSPPHTKHTSGSNFCLVYPTIDSNTGHLIVLSCLDNLVKGAAGQAIQNMNLMLGIPEDTGLKAVALYP
ncbi:MAG: N-acetyl-gamma-glutamyl-phosphate reductase [Dehalococcoidales bacterium]|jgi:N-acetyl-gamma-glutamyl-phosphate reductase